MRCASERVVSAVGAAVAEAGQAKWRRGTCLQNGCARCTAADYATVGSCRDDWIAEAGREYAAGARGCCPGVRLAARHHGVRDYVRCRRAQVWLAATVHQVARVGMALPRRDLRALDRLLIYDHCASAGQYVHRDDVVSRQGMDRT